MIGKNYKADNRATEFPVFLQYIVMFVVPAKLLLALLYTEKCAGFVLKLSGHPSDREEGKESQFHRVKERKYKRKKRKGQGHVESRALGQES